MYLAAIAASQPPQTASLSQYPSNLMMQSEPRYMPQQSAQTYGPFGEAKGTPFTIPVQKNSSIVGFFGRSGIYLDALGVYVHTL